MMEIALVLVPLLFAAAAVLWPSQRTRPWFLPVAGTLHTLLVTALVVRPSTEPVNAWLGFDAVARAVLPMVSILFLVCSAYAVSYLRIRAEQSNRVFVAMLLSLHALCSFALQARHLGLLWIGVEAATLLTVPLLHFNNTARAIEATWKYLIVGGTGVALSLLGSFCLGYASLHGGGSGDLTFAGLVRQGPALSHPWLVAAWVLLLAGYGTKMGLAPMHTWKPDAYGEAPGVVGAFLAGGTTTIAFVAVLRVKQVVDAAGAGAMTDRTLLAFGLFSMVVAALFLLATRDFKRMLAYSSVEHMGILAVGAALGAAGLAAALYHVWSNALTKGALFLSAGNIRRSARASTADTVSGMMWCSPVSARVLVVGLFAATAVPPFGPFFSELRIVRAGLETGHGSAVAVFMICLLFAFTGLARLTFAVVDGRPRGAARAERRTGGETAGVVIPPLVFLAFSLWLGVAVPSLVQDAWSAAAAHLNVAR
ncbi:MAG TPA: proton-conducting transporter membrane subunit [Candidatus Krumholzibacteria bacterium]|nr:proton-conducting transporter membrane subunit [Candidatus Krumholzibacteria bacterium]